MLCTSQLAQSAGLKDILPAPHSPTGPQSIIASEKPQMPKTIGWHLVEKLVAVKQFFKPQHSPKTASWICPFDIQGEHIQCMSSFFHHTQETYLTNAARSGDCNAFIAILDKPSSTFSREQNVEIMHALFILATNRQQAEENKERTCEVHFARMFSDVAERFLPHMLEDNTVPCRDFEYALVLMLPFVTKRQRDFLEHVIDLKNQMENPQAPQYLDDDDELTTALHRSLE